MTGVAELPRPIGYVLGGGASLGAIQVGMLQALSEHGVVPDLVAGTSVGSLNGAALARDSVIAAIDIQLDGGQVKVSTAIRSAMSTFPPPVARSTHHRHLLLLVEQDFRRGDLQFGLRRGVLDGGGEPEWPHRSANPPSTTRTCPVA